MISKAELESCLNILRQYLRCSICLDDFYNPVITPCAHTFCKFCIDNHLGKKRNTNCPLCNRVFSKRSLKVPDKLTRIVLACKKVISTYETEFKTTIVANDGPFDHLHLSQELTQQVPHIQTDGSSRVESRSSSNSKPDASETVSNHVEHRPYRSRIRLGTSSRNKGKIYAEKNVRNCDKDAHDQLTQPMTGTSEADIYNPLDGKQVAPDLDELFPLSLATQPMVEAYDCESLFAPVVGMEKGIKDVPTASINTALPNSETSTHTLLSRPPLPPAHSTRHSKTRIPVNTNPMLPPRMTSKKRASNTSDVPEPPKKQSKNSSSLSTVQYDQGLMTKTHEVLFHVEPSKTEVGTAQVDKSRKHLTKVKSPKNQSKVLRKCHSDSYRHRDFTRSDKLNSLGKSNALNDRSKMYSPSCVASKRLLKKYHIGRFHSSECLNRAVRNASFKSPGWSRWREMYKELRRRSSSFRLAFKKLSKSSKIEKSHTSDSNIGGDEISNHSHSKLPKRSDSLSSWVGFSLSRWSNQSCRRSKRKFSEIPKVPTPLVFETQAETSETRYNHCYPDIIHETPLSPGKSFGNKSIVRLKHRDRKAKETCHFVLPLHRLLPSDHTGRDDLLSFERTAVRTSISRPPLVLLTPDRSREGANLEMTPRSLVSIPVSKSPESLNSESRQGPDQSPTTSCFESLHCSACGETLVLCSENRNWQTSPLASRSDFALFLQNSFNKSYSVSSSYWQAEDPGDAVMGDLHLDSLVSNNRPFAETSNMSFSSYRDANVPDLSRQKKCTGTEKSDRSASHQHSSLQQNIEDVMVSATTNELGQPKISIISASPVQASPSIIPDNNGDKNMKSPTEEVLDSSNPIPQHDTFESPETFTNVSAYQPSSGSEVMPTVDRERLRHECEELEAVVAALQQQLEAEAEDLSPQTEDALLKSACTEPFGDDVILSTVQSKQLSVTEDLNSPVQELDLTCSTQTVANQEPNNAEGDDVPKGIANNQHPAVEIITSDNIEVIPSSQTEEDWDQPVIINDIQPQGPLNNGSQTTTLANTDKSSQLVCRVDASQPPISSLNNSLCEMIPGSFIKPTAATTAINVTSSQAMFNMTPGLTQLSLTNLTHCPETNMDSDIPITTNENWQTPDLPPKSGLKTSVVKAITGSSLSSADMVILRQFCRRFGVLEHSRFIPQETTHVVIKGETDRPRVVKRTLKYFMAILNRAWIVNTDWIRQCLAANTLIDESPYEIEGDTVCGDCHEGPRRGRLGVPAILRPLDRTPFQTTIDNSTASADTDRRPFSGLWLCAYDGLGALGLADFVQLATDGGASKVFKKPEDLISSASEFNKVSNKSTSKPRAIILTNRDSPNFNLEKCEDLYRAHGVPVISIDWMLNCISLYRNLPISQVYRICPSTSQLHNSIAVQKTH